MTNEIVKQVENYFSEKDQWDTFLELSDQRPVLLSSWYSTLRDALNKCFLTESIDDAWGFETWGGNNWDYCWFLNKYGKDYIRVWLIQQSLHFWINPSKIDLPKATNLLKTTKYGKILAAFERLQEPHLEAPQYPFKMVDRGNFYFGDIDDGQISSEKFAWYAHYKTDGVVKQILKKIDRFRESEVTKLIDEFISETPL